MLWLTYPLVPFTFDSRFHTLCRSDDGIGGIVRLCDENFNKVNLDTEEDSVMYALKNALFFSIDIQVPFFPESLDVDLFCRFVYYELPVGGIHSPRLLSGLKLPAKVNY